PAHLPCAGRDSRSDVAVGPEGLRSSSDSEGEGRPPASRLHDHNLQSSLKIVCQRLAGSDKRLNPASRLTSRPPPYGPAPAAAAPPSCATSGTPRSLGARSCT